jgi:His/Glu/Gln/Arg/opine family amino acid ABC transporter permease subunit
MAVKKSIFLLYWIIFLTCLYNTQSVFSANRVENIKLTGSINVSTNAEFEPFEYKDGNKFVGIDMDIAREIAKKLGVDININDVSFSALPLEINKGECDFVIAAMSYSEEKAQNMDFSDPYFEADQVVIVLEGSDIKSSEDLHSKKIGVHLGTTGDIYCTDNLKDCEINRYNNGSEAILDLSNGRIDAVVIDSEPAVKLVQKNSETKILDGYLFKEEYRIAVPKGDKEFLEFINVSLKELKKDGVIDQIINKYKNIGAQSGDMGLWGQIYNNLIRKERYKEIFQGLKVTFEITIVALFIGISIGVFISMIKILKSRNLFMKVMNFIADVYIAIIRGTPIVVQMFVIYYLILGSTGLSKVIVAMFAFGINSGAYVSEIIRAGISSVDKGQFEAGRSLGLTEMTTMNKIIFPQAFKNIIPTLCNEFVSLVKETSVAGFIGIVDLSRAGDIIRSQTYEPFVPLMTTAVIYFAIVCLISYLMAVLERSFGKSDIR